MNHFPLLTLLFPTLLFAASPLCDGKAVGVPWDGTTVNTDWYTANPEADDFIICTAEELAGLAQLVNNNTTFGGKVVNLAVDIDLGEKNWTPIGNDAHRFQGTFDGQNNVISGLSVSGGNVGLFGYVEGGEIRNVGVIGDVSGSNSAGGLVEQASGTTISNSYFIGDVSGSNSAGGLVGRAHPGSTTITNSYSIGDVSSSNGAGGLVGQGYATIFNSYSIGDVSGSNGAGGLVGQANGATISNSYSIGDVSGSGYGLVGGLVGQASGSTTITNSYSIGDVFSGSSYIYSCVGGLVGQVNGGPITISNSYSIGDVSGNYNVGGLVGNNWNVTISSYYNHETSDRTDTRGTPKSTAEMKTQSTYEGWDFANTWITDPSINNGFPTLRSMLESQRNLLTVPEITIANQRLKGSWPTTIERYTGSPIEPAISVSLNGKQLTAGMDYEVSYSNNTEIGTAKIIIKGKGEYIGTSSFKFYIIPADPINIASGVTVDPILDQFWTGKEITPKPVLKTTIAGVSITLREGASPMDNNADYWLSYTNNTNEGTATIHIDGLGSYLNSTRNHTFKIVGRKNITGSGVTTVAIVDSARYIYIGSPITPDVKVTYNPESIILVKDRDYTVRYGTNTNAGNGTIIVEGIGNYTGTLPAKTFPINVRTIVSSMVANIPAEKYTGSPIMPTVTIADEIGTLIPGTDYIVTYASNTSVTQFAQIRITGQGNYTGQITAYFEIYEAESTVRDTIIVRWNNELEFVYNSAEQKPVAYAAYPNGIEARLKVTGATNARPEPYTAAATFDNPADNIEYVLVNNTMEFYIRQAPIAPVLTISNIKAGQTLSPKVTGIPSIATPTYMYSTEENGNYTIAVPATQGTYFVKAIIPPTVNHLGGETMPVPFAITGANPTPIPVTWSSQDIFVYNGAEQGPIPSASLGGISFPVIATGAANAGNYTAAARLVTPSIDYELAGATKNFTIAPKPLTISAAIDPIGNQPFDGFPINPDYIVVRDGTQKLIEGIDYTISYGENIFELGYVYANGINNYSGKISRSFIITSENANVVTVNWGSADSFEYNGTEQCPTATTLGGYELEILGCQANAGGYTAVAQLKTADQSIILANSSRPYTIAEKQLTVEWEEQHEYVYNKMVQYPNATAKDGNTNISLHISGTQSAAGTHSVMAIIENENLRKNYVLNYNTSSYTIKQKPLSPRFKVKNATYDFDATTDTVWVPTNIFSNPELLRETLETLIAYEGFAKDDKGESDDASVLKGKPTVEIVYDTPALSKRVETTQKATATIVTDDVSALNYIALSRPIVVMEAIAEDDNLPQIFCKKSGKYAEMGANTCESIGGEVFAELFCIMEEAEELECRPIASGFSITACTTFGEVAETCNIMTPIMPHIPFPISHAPSYYNLKGQPLGMQKPTIPGVYIEKVGKQARKILVK